MTQIEIDLSALHKAQAKSTSTGRPGLIRKKVTVKRGGKTFQQYRWVKAGAEEPAEKKPVEEPALKPKKELAIMGLNKPEPKKEKSKSELIAEAELLMERRIAENLLRRQKESLEPEPKKIEEPKPEPKKIEEPKDVVDVKKARLDMEKYINKVDKKELGAIALYTNIDNHTSNFEVVNKYIRTGKVDPDNKKNVETLINQVSDFLKDAPKVKGTVYRGMMWERGGEGSKEFEGFLKRMEEGGYVEMNPFTSTSTKRQIVENLFVGSKRSDHTIRFEIKSKSGVFLGDLSAESEESEVLFDKDTKFKIKKVDKSEYPGSVKIIMEEV